MMFYFFCIDGLTGFKDVIEQVYPLSFVQRCIVHMVRSSTRFVSDKDIRQYVLIYVKYTHLQTGNRHRLHLRHLVNVGTRSTKRSDLNGKLIGMN